jgi:hypothetical protein
MLRGKRGLSQRGRRALSVMWIGATEHVQEWRAATQKCHVCAKCLRLILPGRCGARVFFSIGSSVCRLSELLSCQVRQNLFLYVRVATRNRFMLSLICYMKERSSVSPWRHDLKTWKTTGAVTEFALCTSDGIELTHWMQQILAVSLCNKIISATFQTVLYF